MSSPSIPDSKKPLPKEIELDENSISLNKIVDSDKKDQNDNLNHVSDKEQDDVLNYSFKKEQDENLNHVSKEQDDLYKKEQNDKLHEVAKTVKRNQEAIKILKLELSDKDRVIKELMDKL
jgi:hypothetical protein